MTDYDSIKRKVKNRLDQDYTDSKSSDLLIEDLICEVCMEIASSTYFDDLVKSDVGSTLSDGTYVLPEPAIPYQVFINGTEGTDHSWQRVTPITYDYFIRWKEGSLTRGFCGASYRYTTLPSIEDNTKIGLLETTEIVPIKVYYYPIRPTPSDFPGYFEPLIVDKVLHLYSINRRESSSEPYFARLEKRIKQLERNIKKISSQVEIVGAPSGIYNTQTTTWMNANDIAFWRGI